ncbi:relaxase/mobilization nuclease domain-containing protein [Brucellaceae bacterium D45D]
MVPKIADGGENFVAAGNYYLGQGRAEFPIGYDGYMIKRKNSETGESRVAFALTLNLPTADPAEGFSAMQASLERFRELRVGKRGRPLKVPVYSYSLSWAIGEKPNHKQMLDAVHETMAELRLTGHQAVIVSHNDKAYEHVHVIANRILPDLSGTVNMRGDQLTMSNWAEDYERRHGIVFCQQRVENNQRRRRGEFAADTQSKTRVEIERIRRGFEPIFDKFHKKQEAIFVELGGNWRKDYQIAREQLHLLFKDMNSKLDQRLQAAREELNLSWTKTFRRQKADVALLAGCSNRQSLAEAVSSIAKHLAGAGVPFELEITASRRVVSATLKAAHSQEKQKLRQRDEAVCERVADHLWLEYWPEVNSRMEKIRSDIWQREDKKSPDQQRLHNLALRLDGAGRTLATRIEKSRVYNRRLAAIEKGNIYNA